MDKPLHLNYFVRNDGRYLLRGIFSWRLKEPFPKIGKASLGPIKSYIGLVFNEIFRYRHTEFI